MTKYVHPDVMDNGLQEVVAATTKQILCSSAPSDYASALAVKVASVPIVGGDLVLGDGVGNERRVDVGVKTGLITSANATITNNALVDDNTGRLLVMTTTTSLPVLIGDVIDMPAWAIRDVVA